MLYCAFAQETLSSGQTSGFSESESKPTLQFKPQKRSKYYIACLQSIERNLIGPATVGDLKGACKCVDQAISASEVPEKLRTSFITHLDKDRTDILNFRGISLLEFSDTSLVPGPTKEAAAELSHDIRTCVGPIPVDEQVWDFPDRWRAKDKLPITKPIEGLARPYYRGIGGLEYVGITSISEAVFKLDWREKDLQKRLKKRNIIYKAFKNNFKSKVLSCQYRVQLKNGYSRNITSAPYFYWYQPNWEPHLSEIQGDFTHDHPINKIALPRTFCPPKKPM